MPNTYCEDGCGARVPYGSSFVPGHAQRLAGLLRRRASEGDVQAFQELYARGWNLNKGKNALNYGVEAEFFGMYQDTAVDLLRTVGLRADNDGYHHRPTEYWRVTDDGSVSNEGCELVSPILNIAPPHMEDTNKAVTVIRSNGGTVDRSCGLHVHHSVRGKDVEDIAQTVAHYALFQRRINELLPGSRHAAGYARAIDQPEQWYNDITARDSMTSLINASHTWGRYHAVNMNALMDHGTLEFRQHSGTLNGVKINSWVRFTRALMDISKFSRYQDIVAQYGSMQSAQSDITLDDMLNILMLPARVRKFYMDRAEALRQHNGDTEDIQAGVDSDEDTDEDQPEDGESDGYGNIWCADHQDWHSIEDI